MRRFALLSMLVPVVAFAQLDRASSLLFEQKWNEAIKAAEAAQSAGHAPRDTVLKAQEIIGVAAASSKQDKKAKEAFETLLALEPGWQLSAKFPDKATKAFAAAQKSAPKPLDFKAASAALDERQHVMQIAAKVKGDENKLAKKVRFNLRQDTGGWVVYDAEFQGNFAAANTDSLGVEWYAELLGENDRVLKTIGSEAEPVKEGKVTPRAAGAAVAAAPVKSDPVVKPADAQTKPADAPVKTDETKPVAVAKTEKPIDAMVTDEVEPSTPGTGLPFLKPVGYVLVAGGAVTAGVGAIFGVMSSSGRSRLQGLSTTEPVKDISQRDAFALEAQSAQQARLANTLFIAGGIAAGVGVVCWVVGAATTPSDSVSLQFAPSLNGVYASGTF